jgi:hypothetical protein
MLQAKHRGMLQAKHRIVRFLPCGPPPAGVDPALRAWRCARRVRLLGSPKRELREYASPLVKRTVFPRLAPRASRHRDRAASFIPRASRHRDRLPLGLAVSDRWLSAFVAAVSDRWLSAFVAAVSDRRVRLLGSPKRELREYASPLVKRTVFPRLAPRASRHRDRPASFIPRASRHRDRAASFIPRASRHRDRAASFIPRASRHRDRTASFIPRASRHRDRPASFIPRASRHRAWPASFIEP